jgi:hypothetical protein
MFFLMCGLLFFRQAKLDLLSYVSGRSGLRDVLPAEVAQTFQCLCGSWPISVRCNQTDSARIEEPTMRFIIAIVTLCAIATNVQAHKAWPDSVDAIAVDLAENLAESQSAIRRANEATARAATKASRTSKKRLLDVRQALSEIEAALEEVEASSAKLFAQAESDRVTWQNEREALEDRGSFLAFALYVSLATTLMAIIGWLRAKFANPFDRLRLRARVLEKNRRVEAGREHVLRHKPETMTIEL